MPFQVHQKNVFVVLAMLGKIGTACRIYIGGCLHGNCEPWLGVLAHSFYSFGRIHHSVFLMHVFLPSKKAKMHSAFGRRVCVLFSSKK